VLLSGDAARMAAVHGAGDELWASATRTTSPGSSTQCYAALTRKLIDTYESERKPHAKEMIDNSVQMKNFVSLANPLVAKLRNVVVKILLKTPKVGDYIREARKAAADLSAGAPTSGFRGGAATAPRGTRSRNHRFASTRDDAPS
jgi:hypothetical protein